MRNALSFAAALALAGTMGAMSAAQDRPGVSGQEQNGQAIFHTYCASCHGTTGRGDGPVAVTLRTPPADLTQLAARSNQVFVADRVHRLIDGREAYSKAHGSVEMPVWGDAFKRRDGLDESAVSARIDAVVRFLQSIQQRVG